jgi:hypothetical protein
MTQKKKYGKDKYTRDLEAIIAAYIAATGDAGWTTAKVAAWAIANDKWERRQVSAVRQLGRELSRVARQVYIPDGKGNKVRKYHAYRLGNNQLTLWSPIDTITREAMNESKTMRRNTIASGVVQLHFDLDYYNEKHNPGDPLKSDPDFTNDIADRSEPGEYNDAPPEDDVTDDQPE